MASDRNSITVDFAEVPIVATKDGFSLPNPNIRGMDEADACGIVDFRAEIGLPLYVDFREDWMIVEVYALTSHGRSIEVKQPFHNKLCDWLSENFRQYIQDKVDEIDLPRRVA